MGVGNEQRDRLVFEPGPVSANKTQRLSSDLQSAKLAFHPPSAGTARPATA